MDHNIQGWLTSNHRQHAYKTSLTFLTSPGSRRYFLMLLSITLKFQRERPLLKQSATVYVPVYRHVRILPGIFFIKTCESAGSVTPTDQTRRDQTRPAPDGSLARHVSSVWVTHISQQSTRQTQLQLHPLWTCPFCLTSK